MTNLNITLARIINKQAKIWHHKVVLEFLHCNTFREKINNKAFLGAIFNQIIDRTVRQKDDQK